MHNFLHHFAVLLVGCFVAVSASSEPLEKPTKLGISPELKAVAKSLEGRLVVSGFTFYRVSRVLSLYEQGGYTALYAEVDPLFSIDDKPDWRVTDGKDNKGLEYYNVSIKPDDECGLLAGRGTVLNTYNFMIFHQGEFVSLDKVFKNAPVIPLNQNSPTYRITRDTLARLNKCAKQRAGIADVMPFRRIGFHAGEDLITEIVRPYELSSWYGEDPGESSLGEMTHLTILTRGKAALSDFDVRVRAVSVMECQYEEAESVFFLFGWKEGLAPEIHLQRIGDRFVIRKGVLRDYIGEPPWFPFPAYTKTELRQAIAQYRHVPQQYSTSGTKISFCEPWHSGYRFYIYYRSKLVQKINWGFATGC
ncbi:MAG: hypothetical protein FWG81_07715 [Betaproteobacteria bacterium]|nr:hypothetical protein [Betaproteobacteria bacterium]